LGGATRVKLGEISNRFIAKEHEPGHDYEFQGARSAIAPRRSICDGVAFSRPQIAVDLKTMPMKRIVVLVAGSFVAAGLYAQDPKPIALKETVDSLVAKNTEAKGGAQALAAVQSLKLQGKMLVNNGRMELGYVLTKKKPGAVREETSLQGMTRIDAYDGTEGWKITPFGGRKDPEKISVDEAKSLVEDAEIDGPLIDWKAKGSTVEYLGTEDVDGTLAHKLRVTRKNGDINYVYLDPDHFLEIRIITQRMENGAQVENETDIGDYEKINGVFFPFSLEGGPKGSTDKQKIIFEKAEANTPVDDTIFKFPTTASK
jgi:hypothetical protein